MITYFEHISHSSVDGVMNDEVGRYQHKEGGQGVGSKEEEETQSVQHLCQLDPFVLHIIPLVHLLDEIFDQPHLTQQRVVLMMMVMACC